MRLLFLVLFMVPLVLNAQDTSRYEYCSVSLMMETMTHKVSVLIDTGQVVKNTKDYRERGSDGKILKFNNNVLALNYVSDKGWEIVTENILPASGMFIITNYTMRRPLRK